MTNRVLELEAAFPRRTRPLLMAGLVAGDPFLEATLDYMKAVVEGGADAIELLVPFSDPVYHGPVMRRACARAMNEEVGWDQVESLVEEFRADDEETALIVSSYFNRVLARGQQRCVEGLVDAGVDGLMINDLPFDEAGPLRRRVEQEEMALIQQVAPTTDQQRFRRLVKEARGLLVWTGHSGGELGIDFEEFHDRMRELRQYTSLPMVASMNIEEGREAARVGRAAHGVLVGSSLAWLIEGRGPGVDERLEEFVAELRTHLDGVEQ